jgi:ubiquitin
MAKIDQLLSEDKPAEDQLKAVIDCLLSFNLYFLTWLVEKIEFH